MIALYAAPDTISVVTAITLEEAGIPHEIRMVDFAREEQRGADYAAINPKGRVPALATPDGILTETGAILEFIAATAAPRLVPDDPMAAARMREMMYYLASTMHVNHAHMRRGHRWADQETSWEDMRAKVPETMAASAAYVEPLLRGPFLLGPDLCLADPYLFVIAGWLGRDGVDIATYPRLAAFHETMGTRASVRSVREAGLLS